MPRCRTARFSARASYVRSGSISSISGVSASPIPKPATHSGTTSHADVVRRHERERSDAAADEPAADGDASRGVTANESAGERGDGNDADGERRGERVHRPADDEQEHDAEQQRGQRARDEPEHERAAGAARRRSLVRRRAGLNQVLAQRRGDERQRRLRDEDRAPRERLRQGAADDGARPRGSARRRAPTSRPIARRPPLRPPRGSRAPAAPWTARATSSTLEPVGERAADAREREGAERDRRQPRVDEARVDPPERRAPSRRAPRCRRRAPPRRRTPSCAGRRGGSAARA